MYFLLRHQTCVLSTLSPSGSPLFSVSSTMTLIHSIDLYILIDNSSLRWLHKGESWLNILASQTGHYNCPQESNRKKGGIRKASLAVFLINTSITAFYSEGAPMGMSGYWSQLLFVIFSDSWCPGFLCIYCTFNTQLKFILEILSFCPF